MTSRLEELRRILPRGQALPEEMWRDRHQGILVVLWVHAALIPLYAIGRGYSPDHALAEGAIVPAAALLAALDRLPRRTRTAAASVGLLSCSAVLVHLSGGLIEMHFHFFVMVALVALYQDWIPFLAAIGYVLVHHGFMGAIDPESVFNHAAAVNHPWKWGAIHSFFIAGLSAVCLVTWRLNETMLDQRRQAEERLREETHVVETLHEVGKAVAAELDLRSVVQRVTDAATKLSEAGFGAFFYNVTSGCGESYMLYTLSGAPAEAFAHLPMPRNTAIFGPTFAGEGIVRLDDVTGDPRYGLEAPHHGMPEGHLPVRSYLAVPVRSRTGEVLGGLFFGHPEPARFTEVHERLVAGIASHASVAIDNARLYASEREARAASEDARRRLALMAEASRVLSTSLELDDILADLCRLVVPDIADGCVIDTVEDDGSIRRRAQLVGGAAGGLLDGIVLRAADPGDPDDPVLRVMRTGTAETLGPGSASFFPQDGETTVPALADAVIVPLMRRTEAFGALSVVTIGPSGRRLEAEDCALVEEIARRASIAVENARLYAAQRSAAETLQHSLLPEKLPEIPGLALAARYLPGGPGVEVGGDWYDVVVLRDGSLGLAMGDVVGRGVAAASLMGQLRNALRAYALEVGSPAEVMARLNALLHELGPSDTLMATLVYAVFDAESGALRLANAGHPPPLVVGPDGRVAFVENAPGVPLGVLPGATYAESLVALTPGATFVLYTDGLVEDRATPLEEGLERLRAAVAGGPAELEPLCDTIIRRAPTSAGGSTDDVAVLALRYLPMDDHLRLRLPAKPEVLRPLRATLRRWLLEAGANEEEIFEILVATGEACANAIQHAGLAGAEFELEAQRDGGVRILVRDAGCWRPPRPSLGGRGIGIMQQFMDEADVVRGPSGTEVRLLRALSGTGRPDRRL